MMETVTFKLQEEILRKVDKLFKAFHFNNRTEFIREAIRDKVTRIEKEDKVIKALREFKGSAKIQVSDKRLREIREETGKRLAKKFSIKLD